MIIEVRVVPNSKKISVSEWHDKLFVHLRARAEGGKANAELIELLAKHFEVKKSAVRILKGAKTREKLIEVLK